MSFKVSPLVANNAIFSGMLFQGLFPLKGCYLTVAFLATLLALIFFYIPLCKAGDDDLESMALQRLRNGHLDRGA